VSRDRLIFGEDVEDPKGGVFRLTQKLSSEFPEQVFNSPLAESTIFGVACGLASYGKRPVFELQFIDFIGPAFNQVVTNFSNSAGAPSAAGPARS
jgi:2-oxoisovalerate dehydrogenase E1 component